MIAAHTKITGKEDVLDSGDILDRVEYLADTDSPDEQEELRMLTDFIDSESENIEDWEYGVILIHIDYFTQYAEELASDIAPVIQDAGWPTMHIDWEAAAEDLKDDCYEVKLGGNFYYVR